MVLAVPPNMYNRSFMKINERIIAAPDIIKVSTTAFPKIFSALSLSFCPRVIDNREAEPAPINMPKAIRIIIKGNASDKPEMANGPTPCPINIRSTILYSDITTVPTMAGREYFQISLRISSVANSCEEAGDCDIFNG